MTRQQWKGVVDFAHAVDARIVTSFATSPGTRGASGVWTPEQARQLLAIDRRPDAFRARHVCAGEYYISRNPERERW
ncbi:MAG: hypothetical protein ACR2IV_10235 [Bryobacteraceae bacterium]